jgi:hypothetical protein
VDLPVSDIIVIDDVGLRQTLKEKEVCDYVGPLLASRYPGYRWRVETAGGVVNIRCEHTNARYGYTLIPERYFSETQWRAAIIRAGGEILERFNMSRRAFDVANFLARPRNFAGLITPDL